MTIHGYAGVSSNSNQYHVFEKKFTIPKFSMFHFLGLGNQVGRKVSGSVKIALKQFSDNKKVWSWLEKNFIGVVTKGQKDQQPAHGDVCVSFVYPNGQKPVYFESHLNAKGQSPGSAFLEITLN